MKFNLFSSQRTNMSLLVIDGKAQLLFPADLTVGNTPSEKWKHISTIEREAVKPAAYKSHEWAPICTSAADAKFTYGMPDGWEIYNVGDLDVLAKMTPQARYDAKNTVAVMLKLNRNTDADILARLEQEDNRQGYIKRLIREDIERISI